MQNLTLSLHMGSVFRFKQFEVDQGACAMKINTDGVLLGAVTDQQKVTYVLDIGTGTGVIALMLAQKYPEARIDAVEVDEIAARQAQVNFAGAPFSNQMEVFHTPFENFTPRYKYDLIVSNPPFYTKSLHNPDDRKRLARHADAVFFEKLICFVADSLSSNGVFQCIVPAELADWIAVAWLPEKELYIHEVMSISSFEGSDVIRKILKVGYLPIETVRKELFIYESKGVYSQQYKKLLQSFFLAF